MNKIQSFESYLQWEHAKNAADGVLDDQLPDQFEKWVSERQVDDLIELAERYGEKCHAQGYADGLAVNK